MMKKTIIFVIALCIAVAFSGGSSAWALTQGAQCLKLEKTVTKQCVAPKGKKLSRAAKQLCKLKKRKFTGSCASKPVCGQPPYVCPEGVICVLVMPDPVTYTSLGEMKDAGATLLYYGACLPREDVVQ